MGILPYIDAPEQSVEMIQQFGGYNHRISIGDNEFFDMKNMSAKDFPLASVREKRADINVGRFGSIENALGVVSKERLIVPFTAEGGIGVTVNEDVPDMEVNVPGVKIGNYWYSQVHYSDDRQIQNFLKLITGDELVPISNCVFSYGVDQYDILRVQDIRTFYLHKDSVLLKIPHNGVSSISKFAVPVCYADEYISLKDDEDNYEIEVYAGYIGSSDIMESIAGKDVYIGKESDESYIVATINSFSDLYLDRDVLKCKASITLHRSSPYASQPKNISSNSRFVLPITPRFTNQMGVTNIKDYLYTDVAVKAEKKSDLTALIGKKVVFGGQEITVSQVNYDGDNSYITIERPHGQLREGTTAKGERLCLAEIDVSDGSYKETNICQASQGKRFLIEMGGELVIFPEKVIVNTLERDFEDRFSSVQFMERENILKTNFSYVLCDVNGDTYETGAVQSKAPGTSTNGYAWIDTSKTPPELKVWSSQTSHWAVTQAYCQFSSEHISDEWEVGDAVEIEFLGNTPNHIVPMKDQKYFVISAVGEIDEGGVKKRFIRFPASMKQIGKFTAEDSETYAVKIIRTVPDMDFVIESKNRLWGCRYGLNEDGKMINEIFASKLGDAKNWHHFTNTAIDSYYVSMGEDGGFTGACTYKSNPMFFREDCFHTVFGDYPAAYGLQTIHGHGLEKGSDKGITVMNGVVFYKSPVGIMAYTGATPVNITENFGYEKYKNAIASSLGSKMYFSLEDKNGKKTLFSFDDNSKLWHKEDELDVKEFAVHEGEIYALTEEGKILSMSGVNGKKEDAVEWMLESGNIGYNSPFRKRIGRLTVRLKLELDAKASVFVQYDSDGNWNHICNIRPSGRVKSITTPIIPHRCDHFALRIEGKGDCKILSVTKYMEDGSDAD